MFYILTILIILPVATALISPILLRFLSYRLVAAINAVSLMLPGVVGSTYLVVGVNASILEVLGEIKGIGVFALLLDYLNLPILVSVSVVTASVCIYSIPYMEHRFREMLDEGEEAPGWGVYLMLYTLFSSSMLGITTSTNIIEFYLFLELSLIPSFLLIALYGYGDRRRIALMYFIWTHIGAQLFLIGALVYGTSTGCFDFYSAALGKPLVGFGERMLPGGLARTSSILMLIGLFFKMAVLGVHFWLPYAHAQAPTPVSALLSPNLIGLAGYGILRIVITLFPGITYSFSKPLMVLSIATIIYGGLVALRQDDFKRLLAYSSISQMGYILLGISSFTVIGVTGSLLHYLSHAVGKALLFMAAGVFITEYHGLRSISGMGGFAANHPHLFALTLFGVMSLTGLPPSSCLISKFLIIAGISSVIVGMGLASMALFSVAVIAGISLTLGYTFWTIKRIFFGPTKSKAHTNISIYFTATMATIALLGLIVFIYPKPFVDVLQSTLTQYFDGMLP